MRFLPVLALLLAASLGAAGSELASAILGAGLDPDECYQVRELNFSKEDLRYYFTEGYLILGKPVAGRRVSAVFTAEVEGGAAELLLFPPLRSERRSLAFFTDSPNLNEHFRTALMVFTDGTGEMFYKLIREREFRKAPERGVLLAELWNPVVRNVAGNFQVRMVSDLMSGHDPATTGFFYSALAGRSLGDFDAAFDPRSQEQITVGQVIHQNDRSFFDFWTSFQSRSFRTGSREPAAPEYKLSDVRIEAELDTDLYLKATTRMRVVPEGKAARTLTFNISPVMRVQQASIEGRPAEILQPQSARADLIRADGNTVFLVIPDAELEPGHSYEIEFKHEGAVISKAGDSVFYVGARGSWYPNAGNQFAHFDLTFRCPKTWTLVSTGSVVEDREEGEVRITRRRTESPVRLVGFNLGQYERERVERGPYAVEVFANRSLEQALEPVREFVALPSPRPSLRTGRPPGVVNPLEPPRVMEIQRPNPVARLRQVASDIAAGLEFMAGLFGPPPLKTLTVSPIPGTFGQGFPGLVYLSTLSYLEPETRPLQARNDYHEMFFSELLSAHETAHQWWGNVVLSHGYNDDWLMEALANYSALLFLEKRKGARSVETVLSDYRKHLLAVLEDGRTVESVGPVVWGSRLQTSQAPGAWRTIIYEKGSWILHMLRARMGDKAFFSMLGELRKRYEYKTVTTEDFRRLASSFMAKDAPDRTLELFFEQWVYGTGIPRLRIDHSIRGTASKLSVTITLTQSGVDDDFTTLVPVEVQFLKGDPIRRWVRTGDEPVTITIPVKQKPVRVVLDPGDFLLKR